MFAVPLKKSVIQKEQVNLENITPHQYNKLRNNNFGHTNYTIKTSAADQPNPPTPQINFPITQEYHSDHSAPDLRISRPSASRKLNTSQAPSSPGQPVKVPKVPKPPPPKEVVRIESKPDRKKIFDKSHKYDPDQFQAERDLELGLLRAENGKLRDDL